MAVAGGGCQAVTRGRASAEAGRAGGAPSSSGSTNKALTYTRVAYCSKGALDTQMRKCGAGTTLTFCSGLAGGRSLPPVLWAAAVPSAAGPRPHAHRRRHVPKQLVVEQDALRDAAGQVRCKSGISNNYDRHRQSSTGSINSTQPAAERRPACSSCPQTGHPPLLLGAAGNTDLRLHT